MVETRRDVTSFWARLLHVLIETLRVTNQGREGGLSDGGPPNRRYTGHRARVCVYLKSARKMTNPPWKGITGRPPASRSRARLRRTTVGVSCKVGQLRVDPRRYKAPPYFYFDKK